MAEAQEAASREPSQIEFGPAARATRKAPMEPIELAYISWDPAFAPPPPKNLREKIWRFFA